MSFGQTIPFDTSKGGNTPNLCLANVCKGYGIGNKYGSAWEAWQHTQQHTDRPPIGLAIPVFYSYTTTIDGVTQNYGHINVQLPNGTVWSDGNIYASIDDYMSKKLPKFVGWGESVNDVNVIQEGGDNDMVDDNFINQQYLAWFGRPAQEADLAAHRGADCKDLVNTIAGSPERDAFIRFRIAYLYQAALQRTAAPAEVQNWFGAAEKDLFTGICDSAEAKTVTAKYNSGTGGVTPTKLATGLYQVD